ncbi:MAG: hypothetical protein NZ530_00265 [Thermodesulfobacteriaceae bacterium]|nr:hypothetical protein [Thermodesulfobacteriaceae bacterium]MCX8041940.1 hypothetical protein [Thermodesulfobacteriaceae bacterium]MDW8136253.1 hypothetical protein [Thermodesulfobacterium sp.]
MLFLNAKFLTQNFSGVQRFSYELAKELIKEKFEIKIISPQKRYWKKEWTYGEIEIAGKLKGILWEQVELPFYLKKKK